MTKRAKTDRVRSAAVKRPLENFVPPEGVPINLELASLGARFGAVCLDLLLVWATIILIFILVVWSGILDFSSIESLFILLTFFAGIPYYVLSELVWHGRTLGKRIVGIRVISLDGKSLQPHQIVARNLLKQVEFFTPLGLWAGMDDASLSVFLLVLVWTGIVLIFLLRNKRKQRLGDALAGTIVVVRPRAVLLKDLALGTQVSRFVFDQAQLDIYGRYELQTLESILRNQGNTHANHAERAKVTRAIIRRIGFTERVEQHQEQDFLLAFYRAQRERLENRQLFGDRRDDKFHAKS